MWLVKWQGQVKDLNLWLQLHSHILLFWSVYSYTLTVLFSAIAIPFKNSEKLHNRNQANLSPPSLPAPRPLS